MKNAINCLTNNYQYFSLLCFLMLGMFATKTTILTKYQFIRRRALIFRSSIVPVFTVYARKRNNDPHLIYLLPLKTDGALRAIA